MSVLDTLNQTLPDLFRVIDLLGVLLNGILGGRIARIKRFDAVGFMVLAIMCAVECSGTLCWTKARRWH